MPSITKLRQAAFALMHAQGIPEEDRHAVQEAITGKRSMRTWRRAQFEQFVAALQRDAGQHNDRRPHLREDRPTARPPQPGDWATSRQADYIEDLTGQIAWWEGGGPVAYVCQHFLPGEARALRRANLKGARGSDRWLRMTRAEASGLIKALKKMHNTYPAPTHNSTPI